MLKDPPLSYIHNYILTLEEILFSSDKKTPLDYSRLDKESPYYDAEYERSLRRKDLNSLYLLDEIILIKSSYENSGGNVLDEIETSLFSPAFYRDIIFMKFSFPFIEKIEYLFDLIEENIDYLKKNVSSSEYEKLIRGFDYLSPAETKEKLLTDLENLVSFFKKKKQRLESGIF